MADKAGEVATAVTGDVQSNVPWDDFLVPNLTAISSESVLMHPDERSNDGCRSCAGTGDGIQNQTRIRDDDEPEYDKTGDGNPGHARIADDDEPVHNRMGDGNTERIGTGDNDELECTEPPTGLDALSIHS